MPRKTIIPATPLDIDACLSLSSEDRAYMAGFFDGEGMLGVYAQTNQQGDYYVRMIIAQKPVEVLLWMHGIIGGALQRDAQGTHSLVIGTKSHVAAVIKLIRPYLRVKAAQADIVMDFINSFDEMQDEDKAAVVTQLRAAKGGA